MHCVENALWFYGGVPQAPVPDNLKAAVNEQAAMRELFGEHRFTYSCKLLI